MTRLTTDDILNVPLGLIEYDHKLKERLGTGLLGVACHATGADPGQIAPVLAGFSVRVFATTCGGGLLTGFSETVAHIAAHLGCRASVTRTTDVAGLAEAWESAPDAMIAADDDRYVAIDPRTRVLADNGLATGMGFAAALDLMAGGVSGKPAVVMGCGPVGTAAARTLLGFGAKVVLLDPDAEKRKAALETLGSDGVSELSDGDDAARVIRETGRVVEATNVGGTLGADFITPETLVAACGMPLGATPEAAALLGPRLYHDPLETGTAVMLVMLAAARLGQKIRY